MRFISHLLCILCDFFLIVNTEIRFFSHGVYIMDKERLLRLCSEHNITIAELEKNLGMSNGSLRKEGDIKSQRLKAIADFFGVSMEYLMGYEDIPANKATLAIEDHISKNPGGLIEHLHNQMIEHKIQTNNTEISLMQEWNRANDSTKKMIVELLAHINNQNNDN